MIKLLTFCCNCGYEFGRSACGTQTELHCPRCRRQIEYKVGEDEVTVRMVRMYGNQHKIQMQKIKNQKTRQAEKTSSEKF